MSNSDKIIVGNLRLEYPQAHCLDDGGLLELYWCWRNSAQNEPFRDWLDA